MSNDIEREAFEKAFTKPGCVDWDPKRGKYATNRHGIPSITDHYNSRWETWQAARDHGEPTSAGAVPEGYTPVQTKVLRWLLGESGDFVPTPYEQSRKGGPGKYWWRTHLRGGMLTAAPTAPVEGGGVPEGERVDWWKEHLSIHIATLFRANGQTMAEAEKSAAQIVRNAERIAPSTHPHNGEQVEIERGYSKALERRIADLEKGNGEQGGEWVSCSLALPSGSDFDCENKIWSLDKRGAIRLLGFSEFFVNYNVDIVIAWMPTSLKRPAPPTEREGE